MAETEQLTDQEMIKALAHPLRIQILEALDQHEGSPRELADEFGEALGTVSYHVRTLADLGFLELTRTTPRRGAVEHHYKMLRRPVVSQETWERLPALLRQSVNSAVVEDTARDIGTAVRQGGFQRPDIHLSRTPLVLDARGWEELQELLDHVMSEAPKIEKRSTARLRKLKDGEAVGARLVMMLFDTPKRRRR